MKLKESLKYYAKLIPVAYLFVGILRILETVLISLNYGLDTSVLISEIAGLGYDILICSVLLLLLYPLYFLVSSINKTLSIAIFWILALTFSLIHFAILKYFLYQLIPLDIFIYQYSLKEVLYTIKTSDTDIIGNLVIVLLLLISLILCIYFLGRINFTRRVQRVILISTVCALPLFLLLNTFFNNHLNKYSKNKTVFFITKSFHYLVRHPDDIGSDHGNDFKTYHALFPAREFIDEEYPLIHKANRDNNLGGYFDKFDVSPNIVILIVEGLGDDFIHEYKGALLMPFLNTLKDESLYWNRCFTLGERSFAVVPSILGGLPYGQKGFTLLEKLPRHLTLVSVLHSNNYYTSFFYGQGAWFHQKDRFFKFNDVSLLFDNSRFDQKYSKIIVGKDNFFWGYNDKDLFNQSLEVIDTLNESKRLDVYFTGTSHSPFLITGNEYYSSKLENLKTQDNNDFFTTYDKYLKAVLFVDDALEDFFREYKKREDYQNTVFLITGDHPMTEIPIENSLKRYHVPLIIFSEKIKKQNTFSNIVSHLDVSESILSLIQDYIEHVPSVSSSLGDCLVCNENQNSKHFAFMNDNRELVDYYSGAYFLSGNNLYKVDSLLGLSKEKNGSLKSALLTELNAIKTTGLYASLNNKIISANTYCKELNQSIYYASGHKDSVEIVSEYYNFTEDVEIPNTDLLLDFSFNIYNPSGQDISVVHQLSDADNNIYSWKSFGIEKGKTFSQAHIRIDKLPIPDSIVYFKSYIWNENKAELIISDLDFLLHSLTSTSQKDVFKN